MIVGDKCDGWALDVSKISGDVQLPSLRHFKLKKIYFQVFSLRWS